MLRPCARSIWALGPLVARFGQGQVSAGAAPSARVRLIPHITGLEQLRAYHQAGRGL
ncbi:hypothetical protein KCP73_15535 [Salmonella enterica subsp. enterica]|nr:hypothetical protein KCP73_15535 [Salmonella enterica subsp. enterica]